MHEEASSSALFTVISFYFLTPWSSLKPLQCSSMVLGSQAGLTRKSKATPERQQCSANRNSPKSRLLFLDTKQQFTTFPNSRTRLKMSIYFPSPWLNTRVSTLRKHILMHFPHLQAEGETQTCMICLSHHWRKQEKKKGGGKSEFLKGRLEPGKIRASRCNLLMAFVLTNLLRYEKSYALSRTQKNMKNMFICAITLKSMSIETTQKSQN